MNPATAPYCGKRIYHVNSALYLNQLVPTCEQEAKPKPQIQNIVNLGKLKSVTGTSSKQRKHQFSRPDSQLWTLNEDFPKIPSYSSGSELHVQSHSHTAHVKLIKCCPAHPRPALAAQYRFCTLTPPLPCISLRRNTGVRLQKPYYQYKKDRQGLQEAGFRDVCSGLSSEMLKV